MARLRAGRAVIGVAVAALASLAGIRGTQDAVANGDTRTLSFLHTHTNETATVTFRRNGRYDQDALNQINWLLRDWRVEQSTKMDPRLFDIVWEVYREVGEQPALGWPVDAPRFSDHQVGIRGRSGAGYNQLWPCLEKGHARSRTDDLLGGQSGVWTGHLGRALPWR